MMDNIQINVARFDLYPPDTPDSYCVGFNVRHIGNGKAMYRDTLVGVNDLPSPPADFTSDKIIEFAWARLEASFQEWYDSVSRAPSVVGSVFVPPQSQLPLPVTDEPPPPEPVTDEPPPPEPVTDVPVTDEPPPPEPVTDEPPPPEPQP